MKPCKRNRKLIAGLALEELDARQEHNLRAHLETCATCREYLNEISKVTRTLTAPQTGSGVEASAAFHQRLVSRLRAQESSSAWERFWLELRAGLSNRAVALPVIGAIAVLVVMLFLAMKDPSDSPPSQPQVQVAAAANRPSDPAPTISNYQMVANRSLEKFDELLTRQGNRN